MTRTFETGQTYEARSMCDWDCIFRFEVISRTAKFVVFEMDRGDMYRVGVKVDEQGEWAMPFGRYSMAPVIRAATSNPS